MLHDEMTHLVMTMLWMGLKPESADQLILSKLNNFCCCFVSLKGKLLPYAAHYHCYKCTSAHGASHAKAH